MAMITLQVSGLDRAKLAALRTQAKALGLSAEGYARQLIENGLLFEEAARTRTFDELYAPVQAAYKASGMTEDELGQLVDTARARYGRRSARKKV